VSHSSQPATNGLSRQPDGFCDRGVRNTLNMEEEDLGVCAVVGKQLLTEDGRNPGAIALPRGFAASESTTCAAESLSRSGPGDSELGGDLRDRQAVSEQLNCLALLARQSRAGRGRALPGLALLWTRHGLGHWRGDRGPLLS
jgi:hypothetical protein